MANAITRATTTGAAAGRDAFEQIEAAASRRASLGGVPFDAEALCIWTLMKPVLFALSPIYVLRRVVARHDSRD